MKKRRSTRTVWIAVVLFTIGLAVLSYPTVSDLWNRHRNKVAATQYRACVESLSEDARDTMLQAARAYNLAHTQNVFRDAFSAQTEQNDDYNALLDPGGNGVMGAVEIPKIRVYLAIRHGTSPSALERSAGHLEGTSLPVGGEGTHAVLSAHRGLPSAKLFTDVDQLCVGDVFYLYVLNEMMTYRIERIDTVLPEDAALLAVEPGQDLVTLVTCTPYGVNTHRLLLRGRRIPNEEAPTQTADAQVLIRTQYPLMLTAAAFILFFIIMTIVIRKTVKNKERRKAREA